jgi:hypothetical protein
MGTTALGDPLFHCSAKVFMGVEVVDPLLASIGDSQSRSGVIASLEEVTGPG